MAESLLPSSVKFHYVKSNLFRVIHVDGALGGITPGREIFVSLFSERAALPKMIEIAVSPEGALGEEIEREGKEGLVREMDVGIVLNVNAARQLIKFFQNQVKVLEASTPEEPDKSVPETKMQ
jgi:hypothetical protein